jgi:hypothetical protein
MLRAAPSSSLSLNPALNCRAFTVPLASIRAVMLKHVQTRTQSSVPLTSLSIFDAGFHMLLIYFRRVCKYYPGTLHTSVLK